MPPRSTAAETGLALLLFTLAAVALLATSPTDLDFWWQDAPRHALDGAFVMDLLKAMPIHNPVGWAMQYYVQYPALTILFYPPVFHVVEAVFFAIFGVSHATAQLAEAPYLVGLGFAGFAIARTMMSRWPALAVGLLTLGTPEVALWGRQVMLDVPAYATLLGSVAFATRFFSSGRTRDLILSALFLVVAVYTKQTVVFILPALAVGLGIARGWSALFERRMFLTAIVFVVLVIPEAYLTLKFSAVNVVSVSGREGDFARSSLDAWLFYPRLLPSQLGWATLVFGVAGPGAFLVRRPAAIPRWAPPMLLMWLLFGYLFFSVFGVREARHDLMILFPIILCAVLAANALPLGRVVAWALAVGTFAYSLFLVPPPVVTGAREAADIVAREAPKGGVVLYSGYHDGNFVFAMRSHTERPDLTIVRGDKLLLRVAIERSRGVGQTDDTEAEISDTIRRLGVGLVVAQVGFWSDLRQMQRLESVLGSPLFTPVLDISMTGLISTNDRAGGSPTGEATLRIYRPTYVVEAHPERLSIDIPTIGSHVDGTVSGSK